MNCAAPHTAAAAASGEQIGAAQDIKNAMFNNEGGSKLNSDDAKSTLIELFPWVSEFKKMCKCIYADKSMTSLAKLMQYYIRNVSVSVNECYTKPLRAAKLKDSLSETLLLFLYIYRELSEDCNRSIYLNNMSDLLALYIDMELKASRKSKENHSRICTRLTSCLYVYLEHSTEHLLDTLIKIQFMRQSYHHILDPIITKIIKNIPAHPESNIMYVRYLLIYSLWRKLNSDAAVKSHEITTTAIASLGAPPTAFPPCVLEDVLPKVPKCQPNPAKYLMHQKFHIRKCCELFIQFCRESKGSIWHQKSENVATTPSSSKRTTSQLLEVTSRKNEKKHRIENKFSFVSSDKAMQNSSVSLDNLKSSNLNEQTNVKPLGTISTNVSVTRIISKPIKPKVLPRKKVKKSNKIVIIDLTTDIAIERCIKKRKSRKVAWLEEAKKKFDAKAIKASQKMKKQQMAENVNSLKRMSLDQQLEDLLQSVHATENTCLKNDLSASTIRDTKLDSDKIKSIQHFETEHRDTSVNGTIVSPKAVGVNSSDKSEIVETLCTVSSSVIVDRAQSNKSKAPTNSLDVANNTNNINKSHDVNAILEARNGKKMNCRHNTQTVIKRLIEKDTLPESETCKRVESLRKICDLGTEHSKTVNTPPAICAQGDSKDEDDSTNRNANYLSTTKDKLSPHVISSLVHTHRRNDEKDETVETREDIGDNEKCRNVDKEDVHKTMSNGMQCLKSTDIDSDLNKEKFAVFTTVAETRTITTVSNMEILKIISDAVETERPQQPRITENTKQPKEPESQDEYVSAKYNVANNTVSPSIMNGDHSNVQRGLEVGTCIEISDGIRESKSFNHKIRETIFENHTADKKNISNILDMSLCSKEEGVSGEKDIDLKANHKESVEIEFNRNCGKEHNTEELGRSSVLCTKVDKDLHSLDQTHDHKSLKEPYKISHTRSIQNSRDKCIIQDSDLPDNMDGLTLLAHIIAREHASHLKTERELKFEQIKVKDYASLRSSPCNQTTDDEADTNDSSSNNVVSQILENPTTDVINRIVGIYPEDALDKVALHVEVRSTDADDRENDSSNSVPHIVHTTINYETDALSNNLSIMENNVQSIKENTNVILNGETVMLLQKSPNSNLYIINKAVENRDHNSDDEGCPVKEKNWMIPPEDCASFEVVNTSEHISFNLDLPQYNKELSCQENKFSVGKSKGIKIEPEEEGSLMSITEMKSYGKKGSLSVDVLPATSQIYQDTNVANVSISKSVDKRKSKSILTYRQNIKQEFNNHIAPNCGIQGCNGIHSHPHEVIDPQHSLHIPVTHPTTISSIYGNCAAGTDLFMPYHKHCTSVSCSLQINSTTSLHSHKKSVNSCGRSHCSCLNCTYDIVHCRQCMHPATDSHVSCIESNSYFLPAHSSVQTSAVQEHDRTKSDAVISKLYDDQILCKIEQRVALQNNTLEKLDVQREPEKLFKKDMENKLPLKKRLKAQAMMYEKAYEKVPIKTEKLDNYPGIPMMSIAALEPLDDTQKHPSQIIKSSYELSPNEEDSPHGSYHFNSNVVRRDYYKDMHISNVHHNIMKESTRNHERQFRPNGDQSNAVCLEACPDRTFKTPAQRRDVTVTNPTSLKRIATDAEIGEQDAACKKAKKTQSSIRQTRSSKRNVPKVNYCYTDVDPEWNPSGESKRRRRKITR